MRSSLRRPSLCLALCGLVFAWPPAAAAAQQPTTPATSQIFERFRDGVVKVEVIELGSAAKAGVGSGFHVSGDGLVVTNYHVVAPVVHDPERYRAELVDRAGARHEVEVEGLDAVHDLAVVRTAVRPRVSLSLGGGDVRQGSRLYALGHPGDLGLSIVEGTYNGLLEHSLYPRIHFTGSINPGMSGGPTIDADGRVTGVNVATAGDQVSFLVPVGRVRALVERVSAAGYAAPDDLLAEVGRQIHEHQAVYMEDLFRDSTPEVQLGRYRVVTEPTEAFRCWGDSRRLPTLPYETVEHWCATDDRIFIAGGQSSGVVDLSHELVETESLNPWRFTALVASVFARDNTPGGQEEHVTPWECSTRNVEARGSLLRVVLCARGYRKLPGLYDGVLKVAVLGDADAGLVSTLKLAGVSWENLRAVAGRYLRRNPWR